MSARRVKAGDERVEQHVRDQVVEQRRCRQRWFPAWATEPGAGVLGEGRAPPPGVRPFRLSGDQESGIRRSARPPRASAPPAPAGSGVRAGPRDREDPGLPVPGERLAGALVQVLPALPSAEPWSTQPAGALARAEEVSVYWTARVSTPPAGPPCRPSPPSPTCCRRADPTLDHVVPRRRHLVVLGDGHRGGVLPGAPRRRLRRPCRTPACRRGRAAECGSAVEFQGLPLTFRPCT